VKRPVDRQVKQPTERPNRQPGKRLGIIVVSCAFLAYMVSSSVPAEESAKPASPFDYANGWVSWNVPAVEGAQQWCCYSWYSGRATPEQCDLDKNGNMFSSSDQSRLQADTVNLYALMDGGKVKQLKAFSSACAVKSKGSIHQLGAIDSALSLSWLSDKQQFSSDANDQRIPAISAHSDPQAAGMLIALIENRNNVLEDRKSALFWLVHMEPDEGVEFVQRLLAVQ